MDHSAEDVPSSSSETSQPRRFRDEGVTKSRSRSSLRYSSSESIAEEDESDGLEQVPVASSSEQIHPAELSLPLIEEDSRMSSSTSLEAVVGVEPTTAQPTAAAQPSLASPPINMSFSRQTVVDDSDDDTDLSELTRRDYINSLFRPVPPGQRLLCHIIRYREGRTKMFPHFHMMIEQNDGSPALFALSARKRRKTKTSDYIVSLDSSTNSPNTQMVGRLRSNFIGTGYTGSALKSTPQPGSGGPERPPLVEQVGILYEPNILGLKGPRKISIILPTMNKQDEQNDIPFSKDKEVLLSLIKSDAKKDLVMLHNKPPQWNDETHSYVLSFDGRVTVASVKNFQIVHDHDLDYIVMQFGRVSSNRFNLDIQYPLSPIQGFLIAISSFDRKIACE